MTMVKIFCRPVERYPSGHDVITSSRWAPFPGTGEAAVCRASLQETPPLTPHTQHLQAAIAAATSGGLGEEIKPSIVVLLSCCFKHRGKESSFRQLKQQLHKQRRLTWKGGRGVRVRPFLQLFTIWSVTSVDPLVHWEVSTRTV